MKTNYLKVIPVFLIEMVKIAPILIKYGKLIWMEISKIYNKDEIAKLDETMRKALIEGEEV